MANEHVNKVVYGSDTLIDLTEDTVASDKLLRGYTAHSNSGAVIFGELDLVNIFSGNDAPDNSIGDDGDIYIQL